MHTWRWTQVLPQFNFLVEVIRFDQTKKDTWSERGAAVRLSRCFVSAPSSKFWYLFNPEHCMWPWQLCQWTAASISHYIRSHYYSETKLYCFLSESWKDQNHSSSLTHTFSMALEQRGPLHQRITWNKHHHKNSARKILKRGVFGLFGHTINTV